MIMNCDAVVVSKCTFSSAFTVWFPSWPVPPFYWITKKKFQWSSAVLQLTTSTLIVERIGNPPHHSPFRRQRKYLTILSEDNSSQQQSVLTPKCEPPNQENGQIKYLRTIGLGTPPSNLFVGLVMPSSPGAYVIPPCPTSFTCTIRFAAPAVSTPRTIPHTRHDILETPFAQNTKTVLLTRE